MITLRIASAAHIMSGARGQAGPGLVSALLGRAGGERGGLQMRVQVGEEVAMAQGLPSIFLCHNFNIILLCNNIVQEYNSMGLS